MADNQKGILNKSEKGVSMHHCREFMIWEKQTLHEIKKKKILIKQNCKHM